MNGSSKFERTTLDLKNACYALLQERPKEFISVALICSHTGLNRSTFYAHYKSLDELFKEIDLEMIPELKNAREGTGKLTKELLVRMFCYIKENNAFFTGYYDAGNEVDFRPILKSIYQNKTDWEYYSEGINGVLNATIALWCRNDFQKTPEEITAVLLELLGL